MRTAWLVLLALAGCRQALGIPENGSVDQFSIGGQATGLTGVSSPPARVFVEGDELALSEDGAFAFGQERADGTAYTVMASEGCLVDNAIGTVAGDDVVDVSVVCDGLLSLKGLGFSAPLEVDDGFSPSKPDGTIRTSLLTQQTYLEPIVNYAGATIVAARFEANQLPGLAPRFGPFAPSAGTLQLLVENPLAGGVFPSRQYLVKIDPDEVPTLFGYGKSAQPANDERLGAVLAAHGDVMVAGLPDDPGGGAALVFRRQGRDWVEEARFDAPPQAVRFGASVAVSANRIVIGAPGEASSAGALYEYTPLTTVGAGTWSAPLRHAAAAASSGDQLGAALSITDTKIVAGAPGTELMRGAVHVFDAGGQRTLRPPVADRDDGDRFGASVAISALGTTIVVGAPGEDSLNGTPTNDQYPDAGAAYVFAGDWSTSTYVKAAAPGAGDQFGAAVAINASGTLTVIGAPFEANRAGAAYAVQAGLQTPIRPVTEPGAHFGAAIALVGDVLAIGAPHMNSAERDTGAAYVYPLPAGGGDLASTTPHVIVPNNPGEHDAFGSGLALTLDSLIVGAPFEDSGASGWNSSQTDGAVDTGAIYTFR